MDKLQLIERLAELNPQLKTKDAELAVKVMLDAMCGNLKKGERIEIRGFGSFAVSAAPSVQKRNAKTGSLIKAPVKYVPQFKPAKELRERVDVEIDVKTANSTAEIAKPFATPQNQPTPVAMHHMGNRVNAA